MPSWVDTTMTCQRWRTPTYQHYWYYQQASLIHPAAWNMHCNTLKWVIITAGVAVASWRRGRASDLWSRGRGFKSWPGTWHKNPGQVSHTYVPLSPSSTSWYRPKGGDALRLGSKDRYGSCVGSSLAGKTVWSHCHTRTISQHFSNQVLHYKAL